MWVICLSSTIFPSMGKPDFLANKGELLSCILLCPAVLHVNDPVTHHRAVMRGRNMREREYLKM